jgi:uncharacterized protein (DUF2267 family)
MPPIQIPQATFQTFTAEHPLLIKKLLRWAGHSRKEFPDDTRYHYSRSREEYVERYVSEFLVNPPKDAAAGTALMGAWAAHLSTEERHQISKLFGEAFEFTSPDHWYSHPLDEYLVLHEPVIELYGSTTELLGAKTINSYKAQILNCEQMLIVDVDLKEDGTDKCVVALSEEMALAVLTEISRGTTYQWRVYRTAGGLRYIEVSRPWLAYSQQVQRIMHLLYADPLYTLLCRRQETFRARLTPKPWRSDIIEAYDECLDEYFEVVSDGGDEAVCELLTTIGKKTVLKDFREMIEVHDSLTKATSKHRNSNVSYVLT